MQKLQATIKRKPSMRKLKWIWIVLGSILIASVGLITYVYISLDNIYPAYHSKQELIDNYNAKTKDIQELRNYINSIVPPNKSIEIEFEGKRTIPIFHITENGVWDENWNLKIKDEKTDKLIQKLGWTRETLIELKNKLDKANCISIVSGEPVNIGFQRSGAGKYYYKIFNKPLSESLQKRYNDGCTYIYYRDNVVLEYGGGVLGPQCFEDYKKQIK